MENKTKAGSFRVVGLTGPTGSGKSTVSKILSGWKEISVIDCDQLSRRVVGQGSPCLMELAECKRAYDRLKSALQEVEATGYGIVMPQMDELTLEEPEIVKQGSKYGVRLRASAPSIHMISTRIATEISPIVGSEKQSEELVMSLLKDFEEDPVKIWDSNIFGKSLHELVNDGLHSKLGRMPQEARMKLQETIERIINEGCSGLVCLIL